MKKVESVKELRTLCHKFKGLYNYSDMKKKTPIQKFFYHRFLDYLAIYFVKILLYTPITANQATVLSVVIGLVAGVLFASPSIAHWIIGFFVLQLYFIFDAVDGMIARYKKTANPIGKYFDIMAPNIVIPAVLIGMTLGIYSITGILFVFLLGFIALTFFFANGVSNASRNALIYEFAAIKKNQDIMTLIRGKTVKIITKRYVIKKLISFQGFSFLILLAALLDFYIAPFVIQEVSLTFRLGLLVLLAFVLPLQFLKRVHNVSKLQKKVMRFL